MKPEEIPEDVMKFLQEKFPGLEIKTADEFSINSGEVPPGIIAQMDQAEARMKDSLINGTCADCGKKMPGKWFHETDNEEEVKIAEGWGLYFRVENQDEPQMLICPECETAEEGISEEGLSFFKIDMDNETRA